MSNNQQQGQGNNAASGAQPDGSQQSQSGQAGQQSKDPNQRATPGGANPSGGGQPNSQQSQSGQAGQQGGSSSSKAQLGQTGCDDLPRAWLDEEDITQSPSSDASA